MVDIASFRFNDPGRAFDDGYGRVNALRTDRARLTAGNALTGGDYGGAANALYGAGELEAGSRVQGMGESRQAAATKATKDREKEVLDFTGEMAGRLSTILDENKDDPTAAVGAFDTFFAPRLMQMGETPEEIAQVRQQLAGNARQTLVALGAGAAKALGYDTSVVGEELLVVDKATGQLVNRFRGARTVNIGDGGALYEIPGTGGQGGQRATPVETGGAVAPGPTSGDPLFEGMVQQESGGRAGVLGPMTQYGQAEGRTQMLPATAESMARKLGVPWRPDLMRGETPAAAAYQDKLGRAYLDEGLEKYGGDPEKALMYYHGGPDESLWGPKTRAYAQSIMGKVGPQLRGGSGQDQLAGGGEPAPGGPRLLVSRPKAEKPPERRMSPQEVAAAGYQPGSVVMVNPQTGEETVKQGPGAGSGKITDGMRNVASYANDMFAANNQMNELAQTGVFRPTAQVVVSEQNGVTRLVARNPKDAQFVQAANAWLLPLLRKETGAAVTAPELATYMDTYIPLPSDDDNTVRQKADSRRRKMLSMLQQSRPAFEDQFGQAPAEVTTYAPRRKEGAQGAGEIRTVRTPAEARALPPGTRFRTPDGRVKVR